ncbi:MAG: Unknown protein [uncultured Sulfurovum sp.]|uniref:GAF domain-containing protein n=1 Tax=uncultured Sulfurovum sp. TaxID=269237 RepID=A0A6S6SFS8_9BACT|nr:MAG: Unknown protein [uncultured Sulfurovum sp.]
MIKSQHEHYEPREIITNIQNLRTSSKDVSTATQEFLKYSSLLVKSPIALYLVQTEDMKWNLKASYGVDQNNQTFLDDAVNLALSMSVRVVKNKFAYERMRFDWIAFSNQMSLAVKVDDGNSDSKAFIYLIIDYKNQQIFSEMLVRTLMNSDIPSFFNAQKINKVKDREVITFNENTNQQSTDVLEILSRIIFQEKFLLASMFLVNEISARFDCSQVSIGWRKGSYVETIAISHIEKFERHTEAIQSLAGLYEESADQDEEILYPNDELTSSIVFAHHHYVEKSKIKQVLSLPLRHNGEVVGVISCEKNQGSFSQEESTLLRLLTNYVSPWLVELYQKDQWLGKKILFKSRRFLSNFFGFKNTFLKFSAITISALFMYGLLGTWVYKVEAVGTLETDNIAYVSAPFNGIIEEVQVHAGDKVDKGNTLLTFDREELYLKKSEALADIGKYTSESEKARASSKLADMRIALSKKREAELSLDRVEYYLKKSKIIAPVEGIIISGDKEELLGAPTAKGDLLFKVAQSTELYLKLKIPEKRIDDVHVSFKGEFALLSSPNKKYHFEINKIVPVAQVSQADGNVFIAHATILEHPELWWRPGMSGVGKIEIGERNILWIIMHDFIEFLRMYFWI